tara:strand:- start:94 stop:339 length:246 start_codon:yes stop_codon:yes gene_type:complete
MIKKGMPINKIKNKEYKKSKLKFVSPASHTEINVLEIIAKASKIISIMELLKWSFLGNFLISLENTLNLKFHIFNILTIVY